MKKKIIGYDIGNVIGLVSLTTETPNLHEGVHRTDIIVGALHRKCPVECIFPKCISPN